MHGALQTVATTARSMLGPEVALWPMISINGPNCDFLNSMMENKTLSDNFTANAIAEAHTCVRALISSAAALAAAPPLVCYAPLSVPRLQFLPCDGGGSDCMCGARVMGRYCRVSARLMEAGRGV
jgi:hypothetical protein